MNRPSAIVFDYLGTLVDTKECKFELGIKKLLRLSNNPYHVTEKEITEAFDSLYSEIEILNKEFCIEASFYSYYRYIFEKFNITFQESYDQLERIFRQEIYHLAPTNGITEFLTFLRKNQIRTGVLSNNEFSGSTLSGEINRLLPQANFEFIISSADYFFRKPSPRIFEIAKVRLNLPDHQVWYVGDNFENDVVGAVNANLTPVWYHTSGNHDNTDVNTFQVSSWLELSKLIEAF